MKKDQRTRRRVLALPSDAGDSDDSGPIGDSHVPRVVGDWTPQEEMELVFGTKEQQMSAGNEKSPTDKTHTRQHPSAAKASFCSVIRVPVCATLACWQVMSISREIKSVWSLQMDQIPAVPTRLEVGTNPPSLPTGDQRWERQ